MLTEMTGAEWEIVVEAFRAARSRRGGRGQDDRKFLEALHYLGLLGGYYYIGDVILALHLVQT
jgi:hypothetical protein